MRKVVSATGPLVILIALLLVARLARADQVEVKRIAFPVVLSDGHAYSMKAYFYHHGRDMHRPLQVLVHGATYNHTYWDAPTIDGEAYSYARRMAANYPVLALDQLGAGESDHPDGDFFTLDEASSALHQVMARLRTENPTGHRFGKIVLVGHSLGSITAVYAEATYGDADGLVVTGLALTPHPAPVSSALLGPLLETSYVSFPAALRAQLFYYSPSADPVVVADDNAFLCDQVPRGEFVTGLQLAAEPDLLGASLITEPVLVQLGADDVTAPASLAPGEAAYYPGASSVTVEALPSIGHALNLHVDHEGGWDQIAGWIEDHVADGERCSRE